MKRNEADHYTLEARKLGYPARSVFKLMEIDRKFGLLGPGMKVLDIGASPGSWSLYVLKRIGPKGRLLAADLKPLASPIRDTRYQFLEGDAFAPDFRTRAVLEAPFDLVLSDAAPSTTGSRIVDTARSLGLAESVTDLGGSVLRHGGSLVFKIFQGGQDKDLLARLRISFGAVKTFKPRSSRGDSFELFVVASGFRGHAQAENRFPESER